MSNRVFQGEKKIQRAGAYCDCILVTGDSMQQHRTGRLQGGEIKAAPPRTALKSAVRQFIKVRMQTDQRQ